MSRQNRPSKSQVKDYMRENLKPYIDPDTGEANTTGLAELAAEHFDAFGTPPEYLIPQEYYDWASDVEDDAS